MKVSHLEFDKAKIEEKGLNPAVVFVKTDEGKSDTRGILRQES